MISGEYNASNIYYIDISFRKVPEQHFCCSGTMYYGYI